MNGNYDIFVGTVFISGILSFFSPCVFPLIPVYIGKLTDETEKYEKSVNIYSILKTLFFILGLSAVFLSFGLGAGVLGKWIHHPYTRYITGFIVILLGIHQTELINIGILQRQKTMTARKNEKTGILSSFLLGLTFSFGWTPCVGPVLASVLAIAATQNGSAIYGLILTGVYALGMAVPFMIITLAASWCMNYFTSIKKHMVLLKKIGGAIIIFMGILLISGQINSLTALIS